MLEDVAHEAGHRGLVNLDDLVRHVAVRCAVHLFDSISAGRFGQAEGGLAVLVNQYVRESDSVPALDLEVLKVRKCGFIG